MSLTITDLYRKNSKLKGYKPRIGISIAGISEHFSAYREFASDTTLFKGIIKGAPRVRQSCDRLGGLAKVSGINLSVLNLELWSDIFNANPDIENEDVEAFLYFDVADVARRSILFDSSLSQFLAIATDAQLKPAFPISVETWVLFTDAAIGNIVELFASDDQANYSGIFLRKDVNDNILIRYGDNLGAGAGNRRDRVGTTTTIVANRWYCIHGLFKGTGADFFTDAKIYINGVEEAAYTDTGTDVDGLAYGSSLTSKIGVRNSTNYLDGYIAQVGFWDAELSAADALSLYGDGTPKDLELAASYDSDNSGDLQGYWKFQNMTKQVGDDVQVPDETGNSQPAVLTNSPLWSWNIPCCLDTDRLQFFKGKVSDFPSIDYEKVGFKIESLNPFKDATIGELLTDADAADTDKGLPDWGKGKIKPIIYGDHTFNQGNDAKSVDTANIENNMVPAVYLGIDSSDRHRWWIAAHEVNELLVAGDQKQIWGWDSRIGRFVQFGGGITVEQNNVNGCIISHAIAPQFIDYWYPNGTVTFSQNPGEPTGIITGPSESGFPTTNLEDRDFSTKTSGSINLFSSTNDFIQWEIPFPDYDNDIGTLAGAAIVVYLAITYGGGGGDGDFELKVGPTPTGDLTDDAHPEAGGTYPEARQESDELGTATETVKIKLRKENNDADVTCQLDIYEVYKKVTYSPGRLLPLFFGGKGKEYGAWINDREAGVDSDPNGNLYTETHADHDGQGSLIENAAGVVESLQVDEIGLANTDIHEDSYNISSNDLSTSLLSFSIIKQIKNSAPMLNDLLKTIKSVMFMNSNNESKMRTFVPTDPFSASGDSVPNNEDIFEFSPQTTFKIVTGENDKIRVLLTNFTLTAGEYTGASLASHLQTIIQVTYGDIDCSYSVATGKFEFAERGNVFDFDFEWLTEATNNTVGRFIGFDVSADDILTKLNSIFSDYPLWADSYVEHPMVKRPLPNLDKTKDDIKTTVLVKYFIDSFGEYNRTVDDTDVSFHSATLEKPFEHKFTRDQTTAEIFLFFLSKNADHSGRLSRKFWKEKYFSWLNSTMVEPWDHINIREPVLSGILGSANMLTQKWLVTEVEPGSNIARVGFEAVEV